MHKVFLSIAMLTQMSFCMQRLDEKKIPSDFICNLPDSYKEFSNTTPKQVYEHCFSRAKRDKWACEHKEYLDGIQGYVPENCGTFAQAARELKCWWFYKQALARAIDQK